MFKYLEKMLYSLKLWLGNWEHQTRPLSGYEIYNKGNKLRIDLNSPVLAHWFVVKDKTGFSAVVRCSFSGDFIGKMFATHNDVLVRTSDVGKLFVRSDNSLDTRRGLIHRFIASSPVVFHELESPENHITAILEREGLTVTRYLGPFDLYSSFSMIKKKYYN